VCSPSLALARHSQKRASCQPRIDAVSRTWRDRNRRRISNNDIGEHSLFNETAMVRPTFVAGNPLNLRMAAAASLHPHIFAERNFHHAHGCGFIQEHALGLACFIRTEKYGSPVL
jgi:hypothetical protein